MRSLTEGDSDSALSNAKSIVALEDALGFFVEPALQTVIIGEKWMVNLANWVYLWGHWPVMAVVGVWLYLYREKSYRLYRTALICSGAIGLVMFMTYPVAPPRLTDLHFVDTITAYSNLYHVLQPAWLTNQLAAFPSLHFGWNLLISIALLTQTRNPAARVFGWAMPVIMLAAIVLTANHYLVDAIGGGAVALVGLAIAAKITGSADFRTQLGYTSRIPGRSWAGLRHALNRLSVFHHSTP